MFPKINNLLVRWPLSKASNTHEEDFILPKNKKQNTSISSQPLKKKNPQCPPKILPP